MLQAVRQHKSCGFSPSMEEICLENSKILDGIKRFYVEICDVLTISSMKNWTLFDFIAAGTSQVEHDETNFVQ